MALKQTAKTRGDRCHPSLLSATAIRASSTKTSLLRQYSMLQSSNVWSLVLSIGPSLWGLMSTHSFLVAFSLFFASFVSWRIRSLTLFVAGGNQAMWTTQWTSVKQAGSGNLFEAVQ